MSTATAAVEQFQPTSTRPTPVKTPVSKAQDGRRSNAIKHGMTAATDVLLPDEDPAEYAELVDRLSSELAPVGVLEERLVLRLANAFVRLQRSERFERGVVVSEGCSEPSVGLGLAFIRATVKGDTLGKAMKYGMAAERSVWSILACLDRLRAARLGQAVPVPAVVNINVSGTEVGDDGEVG